MEDFTQAKIEIARLSDELQRHQKLYYLEARPEISDLEYDKLMDRLVELENQYPSLKSPFSPSQRVGSDLGASFPEVTHTVPVLSLDKAYSSDAVSQWIERVRNRGEQRLAFVVEEKMDGVSLVLYYKDGVLDKAVTRGNGFVGNDVTANAKTISSVPLRLSRPIDVAVRGEVFLAKADFEQLNLTMEVPYANPRNLAAGTLRRIKSSETARIPLRMFAYEASFPPEEQVDTHVEVLGKLKSLGFLVNPSMAIFAENHSKAMELSNHLCLPDLHIADYGELSEYIVKKNTLRNSLPYEIDGLVVKVNELAVRDFLGYTGHHPRWALAYKFEAPEAQTVVKGIDVQVGRTGRITPVARVETVKVGNSMVSNVTLHNQDYINLLELSIGDSVAISKRGDVIPAVERVVEKNEEGNSTWTMPTRCPSCDTILVRQGAHIFCPNESGCPDQIMGRVVFFVGRDQMDIEGFGPETVSFLMEKGLVKDIPDIYTVDYAGLVGEPGFGEKKVASLAKAVEESRNRPFRTVLVSLGIPDFGKKAVDLLVSSGIVTMDRLLELVDTDTTTPLLAIKGFGQKTVDSLFAYLSDVHMRERIARLRKCGLQFEEHDVATSEQCEQVFSGQTWCVTGSFTHFSPRSLALKEIESRGGRTTGAVTGKTTHLLAGTGAGSKLQQAIGFGTTIVSEEEFLKMLEGEG